MENSTILALFAIGLIATTGLVSAYQGDDMSVKGPYFDEERHAIMEDAFATLDYDAWVNQMSGKGRVTEIVTEENFERFAEAHEAKENGNLELARQIRAELGLGLKDGSGQGRMQGSGQRKMQGSSRMQGSRKGSMQGSARVEGSRQGSMQGPRDGSGIRQANCPYN